MIPKIAHYHWTGKPMSWLRWAGIASFRRWNPDWEIRIHDTDEEIRNIVRLESMQKGDLSAWRNLFEHGGFHVDSDIIFLRPIPEEWLSRPLCVEVHGEKIEKMAMVGSVPLGDVIGRLLNYCHKKLGDPGNLDDLQVFGVTALNKLALAEDDYVQIPEEALCQYNCGAEAARLWDADFRPGLKTSVIGIHWYGGHHLSRQFEPKAKPSGKSFVEYMARNLLLNANPKRFVDESVRRLYIQR